MLGFAANLAAVAGGGRLSAASSERAGGFRANTVPEATAGGDSQVAGDVEVRQVSFLSASSAEVVYRSSDGVLFTGRVQLGSSGIWRLSLSTFCNNLRAGLVGGDVPPGVAAACEAG